MSGEIPPVACTLMGKVSSRGLWFGDNPLKFSSPILMVQIFLCSFIMSTLHALLHPLVQSSFVSQMIGGIILGKSVIGRSDALRESVVNDSDLYVVRTFQYFGFMFVVFLVGLKTDMTVLVQSGRKVVMIGFFAYLVPLLIAVPMAFFLKNNLNMDPKLAPMLPFVAVFECSNSFHNIICLLTEVKLLNSELGRLAVCSSMMSGTCSFTVMALVLLTKQSFFGSSQNITLMILSVVSMIFCVFYVLRPIMFWIIKNTPEGERIREFYVFLIFLMILVTALFGEIMGQHSLFGPILLGIAVPPGPPLASALENKLHLIVSTVLLPLYFISHGSRVDLFAINPKNLLIVQFISFLAFVGKIIGTILPSLYCQISLEDATWLGVILSAQGIIDLTYFKQAFHLQLIDEEVFSIMVLWALMITAIIAPLLFYSYKPSKKYNAYKRTLQDAKSLAELRILTCIYVEANVPTIINLLEAMNPTRESPIYIYLLHLIELQGMSAPLLLNHQKASKKDQFQYNHSKHVINAFKFFEQHNRLIVTVNPFTSITSYPTMHNDICSLAMEKKTNFIIIPFHRQTNVDGILESSNSIRNVNRLVLSMAPCTVGLLVDQNGNMASQNVLGSKSMYRVLVLFLGGGDDRETLNLGMRMAEHSNIHITLVRLMTEESMKKSAVEKKMDGDIVNEFRLNYMSYNFSGVNGEKTAYKEVQIKDGVDMVKQVRALEESFNLIMVGRQHGKESMLDSGLTDWNEFPELGYIGDMLATSETSKAGAVLVLQKELIDTQGLDGSPKARFGGI